MEEQRKGSVEPVGAATQKKAEEITAGRGQISGMEGDESPSPVTPGSRPTVSSTHEGEEGGSKGTAGPTAQLNRRTKGKPEQSESSFR